MLLLLALALYTTHYYNIFFFLLLNWYLLVVPPLLMALLAIPTIYMRHKFSNTKPWLAWLVTVIFILLPASSLWATEIITGQRAEVSRYTEKSFDAAQIMLAGSCELRVYPYMTDFTEMAPDLPKYAVIGTSRAGDAEQYRVKVNKDQWEALLRNVKQNASTPDCIKQNHNINVETDIQVVSVDAFLKFAESITCVDGNSQLTPPKYLLNKSSFHNVEQNSEYVSESAEDQAIGGWLAVTLPYHENPVKEVFIRYANDPTGMGKLSFYTIGSLGEALETVFFSKLQPCDVDSGQQYIHTKP